MAVRLVALAIGAVIGAFSRYFISLWLNSTAFPYGTLVINATGCLIIGFFATLASERMAVDPNLRVAVQFGFLGSYTTFSSFGYETLGLLEDKRYWQAGLNFLGNNALGLLAVWAGMAVARALPGVGRMAG